jgi:hypothetical protein
MLSDARLSEAFSTERNPLSHLVDMMSPWPVTLHFSWVI